MLLAVIAKSKFLFIAGLIPLFPTFAVMAHVIAGNTGGPEAVKQVAWFGMLAIIPYSGYLLTMIHTVEQYRMSLAITFSVGAWIVLSAIIVFLWNQKSLAG